MCIHTYINTHVIYIIYLSLYMIYDIHCISFSALYYITFYDPVTGFKLQFGKSWSSGSIKPVSTASQDAYSSSLVLAILCIKFILWAVAWFASLIFTLCRLWGSLAKKSYAGWIAWEQREMSPPGRSRLSFQQTSKRCAATGKKSKSWETVTSQPEQVLWHQMRLLH